MGQRTRTLIAFLGAALLAGCAGTELIGPPMAFRLSSPALPDNAMLASQHGGDFRKNPNCLGQNVSPPLAWVHPPEKTRSYVLLMDDQAGRGGLGVNHAVLYGIPAATTAFAEGELGAPTKGNRFVAGKNTLGLQYLGPCPPRGNAPQHYVFTLIATDLDPAALKPGMTKDEVLKALQGGKALRAASLVFRYAH
jgi:hypothetical protein